MDSDVDDDDNWSETSSEDATTTTSAPIQSRPYQIEMFEQSMQGNIIAVMGTGSGKTQVAKLRIDAELQRTPGKRIWFTAPSVVLAYQQYAFLSQQLPRAQFILITGMNNPDDWDTQELWDKALLNIHVVVCTPQILLNALDSGFVSLKDTSLLVVDEAHHCVDKHPLNMIMKNHYHTLLAARPSILGLSASPVTKKSTVEMEKLEINLNAKCKAPTRQVDEYAGFVNVPKLDIVSFVNRAQPAPKPLAVLKTIIDQLNVDDDPFMQKLQRRKDPASKGKLNKILRKNRTPTLDDLHSFLASAVDLQEALGPWAACMFIATCLHKIKIASDQALQSSNTAPNDAIRFISRALEPLHTVITPSQPDAAENFSEKVNTLLNVLRQEYRPTTRALIFVKTRHTAWALTNIIQAHRSMQHYHPFFFVGCTNPARHSIFDFAQLHLQHENLEKFRGGELNLCIATSVMEEGVDVPAMNLVTCFDEPPNLRSFIQSRGRARQKESRFILLREKDDSSPKLMKWHAVEEEMKLECADENRNWEERQMMEDQGEQVGELFRVPSTGATLTYDNSKQRLEHFCAKVPRKGNHESPNPVYVISVSIDGIRATVHLPTLLDPNLQVVHSKSAWQTEKMALRDAAFQAYKKLYTLQLVTEHLLPQDMPKEITEEDYDRDREIEKRESVYAVGRQYNPWLGVMGHLSNTSTLYSHQIQAIGQSRTFPTMALVLPLSLRRFEFSLHVSASEQIRLFVSAGKELQRYPFELSRKISFHLLNTILSRRLLGAKADETPLILVPDLPSDMLQSWYDRHHGSSPFAQRLLHGDLEQGEHLLRTTSSNIPYVFVPPGPRHEGMNIEELRISTVEATKLSRRLDYLSTPNASELPTSIVQTSLAVGDCQLLNLPASYGHFILLAPSMTHVVETVLRSTEACNGPLSSLEFHNIDLVSEALTLPAASTKNYQRLEFLGDDLLKYHTSIQLFVDYPYHPESRLSLYRDRIITNSRLQRATRTLGLDKFLTREKFSGQQWTAGSSKRGQPPTGKSKKELSSKILADIIEALVGAAFVDGERRGTSEPKTIAALKLFIDEVAWETPAEKVAQLNASNYPSTIASETLEPVEEMLDYSFEQPRLLAEALTHSSYNTDTSSYDRLEFLGDAVLDHIVKLKLYHSEHLLDPDQMTLRRHALVSHATLSFFALQISHISNIVKLETDPSTGKTAETQACRMVYLPDHIRRVETWEASKTREITLRALDDVESDILAAFERGRKFPWAELFHLGTSKSYSDVLESILGAVFVDSGGRLDACERMLENIGFMTLVNRLATEKEIDTQQPEQSLSRLPFKSQLVSRNKKNSGWRCKVLVDGEHVAHFKQATCKEEAQCRAAERALKVLSKKRKRTSTSPLDTDAKMPTRTSN